MREKFDEILKEHGIYGEDVENILNAVYDMVIYAADEMKRNEPYATNAIDWLEKVAYEIFNLKNEL